MLLLLQMFAGWRSGTSGTGSRGSQKPRQVLGHWHEGGDHRYFDDDDRGDDGDGEIEDYGDDDDDDDACR